MNGRLLLNAQISAEQTPGDGGRDGATWLNLAQDEIDPRFSVATDEFLSTLLTTVSGGGDPYSLISHDCPVVRSIGNNVVTALYSADVLVNRSENLDGLYSIDAGGYKISGPVPGFRLKSGEILTDGRKVIELGFLANQVSVTQEYPLFPKLDIEVNNGFMYIGTAEYAIIHVSGIAIVDIWTVTIEHVQGRIFPDREIKVTASWGIDNEESILLQIPGCVLDAFNQCPDYNLYPNGIPPWYMPPGFHGGGNPGANWDNIQLNPEKHKVCYINGCTGAVMKCIESI